MNPHADPHILFIDTDEQFTAQGCGDGFDLFDQGQRRSAQNDLLRPAILDHRLPLHQTLGFQAVEQPRQGRSFDADTLGKFTLGRGFIETGKVQQHQPAGLGQAKSSQTAIQFGAPASGHLRQLHAKTVLIG